MISNDFAITVRNANVLESLYKAERHLATHERVLCSVSGGSDSDVVLDMICLLGAKDKTTFVWFDTGLEYAATKKHLEDLEKKYGIKIHRRKAILPIPACCKKYGQPFLSKYVSSMIERLQRHDFQWEDESYDTLLQKYPNAKSALKWWCNWHDEDLAKSFPTQQGNSSRFSISRNKFLKEFIISNPPQFKISAKCCQYAKKDVATKAEKEFKPDMSVIGVRKAEGGIRAAAYKSCYGYDEHRGIDACRPIFWFTNEDKEYYCKRFDIVHSDCYTVYGLKRTGCVGCPFNRKCVEELAIIEKNEPRLYNACKTVFAESYEYTRKYREFVAEKKTKKLYYDLIK